jgi:hypothetical protein
VVVPVAAAFLVPWRELRRSWLFVALSVLAAEVPTLVVSIYSQDFPVVVGGFDRRRLPGFERGLTRACLRQAGRQAGLPRVQAGPCVLSQYRILP